MVVRTRRCCSVTPTSGWRWRFPDTCTTGPRGAWLDTINAPGVIHFCRATQQSLLRLLTNRTVLGAYGSPPLTNREAWAAYAAFLDDDRIVLAGAEPDGLEAQWRAFAVRQSPAPKVWMDAYLAAFALTGGFELVTTDTAFTQYGGIELRLLAK